MADVFTSSNLSPQRQSVGLSSCSKCICLTRVVLNFLRVVFTRLRVSAQDLVSFAAVSNAIVASVPSSTFYPSRIRGSYGALHVASQRAHRAGRPEGASQSSARSHLLRAARSRGQHRRPPSRRPLARASAAARARLPLSRSGLGDEGPVGPRQGRARRGGFAPAPASSPF